MALGHQSGGIYMAHLWAILWAPNVRGPRPAAPTIIAQHHPGWPFRPGGTG